MEKTAIQQCKPMYGKSKVKLNFLTIFSQYQNDSENHGAYPGDVIGVIMVPQQKGPSLSPLSDILPPAVECAKDPSR